MIARIIAAIRAYRDERNAYHQDQARIRRNQSIANHPAGKGRI